MTELVVPVFQYGGSFVKDNKEELVYINGSIKKFDPMDINMINYFDMKKLFEEEIMEMCENKRQNQGTNEVYLFSDQPIIVDDDFSDAEISDDDSYDSYESVEDEPYKPPPPGYESDIDEEFVSKGKSVGKKAKTSNVQSCSKKKVGDSYKKKDS
ncbi:hypothetical protein PIB30_056524 [Stylosanthes scabra]|uniref:PB1-like domain-containing protein n=1 Tax=Stylosanthes scabra TaxID=79078 RepID=A0ABU6QK49_9FABA|nr:hypothetical protein [Stylosanthes scabra]